MSPEKGRQRASIKAGSQAALQHEDDPANSAGQRFLEDL
jgi:hypothetical protein